MFSASWTRVKPASRDSRSDCALATSTWLITGFASSSRAYANDAM